MSPVHGSEYHPIVNWRQVVWVVPCGRVVDCGAVLIGHDIHLVEMKLWDVGVRSDVDMFLWHEGEIDGRSFGLPGCFDDGGDIC